MDNYAIGEDADAMVREELVCRFCYHSKQSERFRKLAIREIRFHKGRARAYQLSAWEEYEHARAYREAIQAWDRARNSDDLV
jgi:hypothetical protein